MLCLPYAGFFFYIFRYIFETQWTIEFNRKKRIQEKLNLNLNLDNLDDLNLNLNLDNSIVSKQKTKYFNAI